MSQELPHPLQMNDQDRDHINEHAVGNHGPLLPPDNHVGRHGAARRDLLLEGVVGLAAVLLRLELQLGLGLLEVLEAAALGNNWMSENFDDSEWNQGIAPFRYGDGDGGTVERAQTISQDEQDMRAGKHTRPEAERKDMRLDVSQRSNCRHLPCRRSRSSATV